MWQHRHLGSRTVKPLQAQHRNHCSRTRAPPRSGQFLTLREITKFGPPPHLYPRRECLNGLALFDFDESLSHGAPPPRIPSAEVVTWTTWVGGRHPLEVWPRTCFCVGEAAQNVLLLYPRPLPRSARLRYARKAMRIARLRPDAA